MEKLNLPPFHIGQKVIYITGKYMPKNSIHTVEEVIKDVCGCYIISVNTKTPKVEYGVTHLYCGVCKKQFPINKWKTNYWNASSFRAAEEINIPLMTFSEIKKKEKQEILILN